MFDALKRLLSKAGTADDSPPEDGVPAELLARARTGDLDAENEIGLAYVREGETDKARRWFDHAARQGSPRAKHNMGVLAAQAGDRTTAIRWFRTAVADGWRNSVAPLGLLLEQQDDRKGAIEAYEIGAGQGCHLSQDALGRLAMEEETEESYQAARRWCELSARQGNESAQTRLGTIFHEGLGVERDPKQAAHWFLAGAQRGHQGAQMMIGMACHLGIGVEADRLCATRWLRLSASQGNEFARAYLHRVESELTPEERSLLEAFPDEYAAYQRAMPWRLIPKVW